MEIPLQITGVPWKEQLWEIGSQRARGQVQLWVSWKLYGWLRHRRYNQGDREIFATAWALQMLNNEQHVP